MKNTPVISLIIFLSQLFLISCGTTSSKSAPPPEKQTNNISTEKESLAEKRLDKAMQERSFLLEQNKAFALNYYILGKRDYENLKLESAREHLALALRYDPELREAESLFVKVQGLLGERPDKIKSFMDRAVSDRNVKTEQMMVEIENLIKKGDTFYSSKEFSKAADAYRNALLMMERLPYYVKHPEKKETLKNKLMKAKQN